MCVPEDVRQIVNAVGVPGDRCCALIYRDRDAGHIIAVTALPNWFGEDAGGRHWASAITAACPAACRR